MTLAVLKFFLGQDQKENDGDSDDEDEPPPAAPSREDMYKAKHKVWLAARVSEVLLHCASAWDDPQCRARRGQQRTRLRSGTVAAVKARWLVDKNLGTCLRCSSCGAVPQSWQ